MKKLFSLLALVGVIAACQPEKLETAFEVADAVATITVNAVDVNTQKAAVGVTFSASDAAATVSGNVITVKGNPALTARTVDVTATFQGKTYTQSVSVNALRAGGVASYSITIPVGVPVSEQTLTFKLDSQEVVKVETEYFKKEDGHALVDHAGKMWAENLTEFLLEGEVSWVNYTGIDPVTVNGGAINNANYTEIVDLYKETIKSTAKLDKTPSFFEFTVSAWAYYTVYATRTQTMLTWGVYADDVLVGEIYANSYSSEIEYEEIANPMGHGHYHAGHGNPHGHGEGGNAGGGIVWGE